MTPPLDLAALRALLEEAKHGPVARRMIASAKLADALPALLDRLERAERDSQRLEHMVMNGYALSSFTRDGVLHFRASVAHPWTTDWREAIDTAIEHETLHALGAALTPTPEQP